MTKTLSVRLSDEVAALAAELAARNGTSLNRAIEDAIRDAAANGRDAFMEVVRSEAERYRTVMELLA